MTACTEAAVHTEASFDFLREDIPRSTAPAPVAAPTSTKGAGGRAGGPGTAPRKRGPGGASTGPKPAKPLFAFNFQPGAARGSKRSRDAEEGAGSDVEEVEGAPRGGARVPSGRHHPSARLAQDDSSDGAVEFVEGEGEGEHGEEEVEEVVAARATMGGVVAAGAGTGAVRGSGVPAPVGGVLGRPAKGPLPKPGGRSMDMFKRTAPAPTAAPPASAAPAGPPSPHPYDVEDEDSV